MQARAIFSKILKGLLLPIARFCIKRSLTLHELTECMKAALVVAAEEELKKSGARITDSRLSVMSGVHRKDVVRLRSEGIHLDKANSLPVRVIGRWQSDKRFLTKDHKPRVLSVGFEGCEFDELVASESKDMNPASVRFELERVLAVESTPTGIRLLKSSYIPKEDVEKGFAVVSNDINDLLLVSKRNIEEEPRDPLHHLRTEYDRIRPENFGQIKQWLLKEGHDFHARVRRYISQFDQDVNPKNKFSGKTGRAVFSSFSLIEEEAGKNEK